MPDVQVHAKEESAAGVDLLTDLLVPSRTTITVPHYEIHTGNSYMISYLLADGSPLADDASISFQFTLGLNRMHFTFMGACGGHAELSLLRDPTVTGPGGLMDIERMRQDTTDRSSTSTVRLNSAYTGGAVVTGCFMPNGVGPWATGGLAREDTEIILATTSDYILVLTNRAGGAQPASLFAQWYEES